MNIFRVGGDLCHLFAILSLLFVTWKTRSCSGVSAKTQILFTLVYITRYLDVLFIFISLYNTVMKITFLLSSVVTLYFIFVKFKATYSYCHDNFRIEILVLPSFVLALIVNHEPALFEVLWTFSVYLEAVALVPQFFMVWKMGEARTIISFYFILLAWYKSFYLMNWYYRYSLENHMDQIVIAGGIVQTILCWSFFFYSLLRKKDMSVKTGLLVVTNFKQVGSLLSSIQKKVTNTLYVQILNVSENTTGNHSNFSSSLSKYSREIRGAYIQAASYCKNLDVRILLSGIKFNSYLVKTHDPIEIVIFDKDNSSKDIDCFINGKIVNLTKNYEVLTLDHKSSNTDTINGKNEEQNYKEVENKIFKHGVIGGTFDRLHTAHKLLLSEIVLRSEQRITIGVTDENMTRGKILNELIEDLPTRIENLKRFMTDICPEIPCNIVPISDPFGPSVVDPTMDMIVVSHETLRGGEKVNEVRESKGLPKLHIHQVELMEEPENDPSEEMKISSSTARMRLLGTVLKPIEANINIPPRPYIIGLTGGIASGKSGLSQILREMGALVIDADLVAHDIYKLGKPCYKLLIQQFGEGIIGIGGEIDRKKLGAIVFKDRNELEKLNNIVWPEMLKDILEIVGKSKEEVIVIDAAILLQAEWNYYCHEVWTSIIPRDEAIQRLMKRNQLTEEQALLRIQAQPSNSSYVQSANVVFCTLWDKKYTKKQVEKAWKLLKERMNEQSNQRASCKN